MITKSEYFWTLEAFERQGTLWLKWSTNAPFRAQQSQVYVYKNGFPGKPVNTDLAAWQWVNVDGCWNTGLEYGTGWCCALGAQELASGSSGEYVYVAQLTT